MKSIKQASKDYTAPYKCETRKESGEYGFNAGTNFVLEWHDLTVLPDAEIPVLFMEERSDYNLYCTGAYNYRDGFWWTDNIDPSKWRRIEFE